MIPGSSCSQERLAAALPPGCRQCGTLPLQQQSGDPWRSTEHLGGGRCEMTAAPVCATSASEQQSDELGVLLSVRLLQVGHAAHAAGHPERQGTLFLMMLAAYHRDMRLHEAVGSLHGVGGRPWSHRPRGVQRLLLLLCAALE